MAGVMITGDDLKVLHSVMNQKHNPESTDCDSIARGDSVMKQSATDAPVPDNSLRHSPTADSATVDSVVPSEWMALDCEAIVTHLERSPLARSSLLPISASDIDLHLYICLPSTNTMLWEKIREGHGAGTVVIAHQQSAGKGQWGRQWQSSAGGLYLSMALEPNIPAQEAAQLTLCTAWGVAIALRSCGIPVQIKWPNDLVIPASAVASALIADSSPKSVLGQGKIEPKTPLTMTPRKMYKLGGILTETRIQGQMISHAVVGIGLNGGNVVPEPGIALSSVVPDFSPTHPMGTLSKLAAIAIHGIWSGWQQRQREGIHSILSAYAELLIHQNQMIHFEQDGKRLSGQVIGVTASGELRMRLCSPFPSSDLISHQGRSFHQQKMEEAGTSSSLQSSEKEIRISPGTVQLGYGQ